MESVHSLLCTFPGPLVALKTQKEGGGQVDKTMSIKEAASILGKNEKTLRRWTKEGKMSAYNVHEGKRLKIRLYVEEVEALKVDMSRTCPDNVPKIGTPGENVPKMSTTKNDTEEQLRQAVYRVGYLQGQLDNVQKALSEGQEMSTKREEALKALAVENSRLKIEREALAREKETLAADVEKLRRPWWKKLLNLE